MKRLLGLLALLLVPALLTVPTAAPAQAVDANDIEARTEKILVLAAQKRWTEVARYTNPKMLAWLRARDHQFDFTPSCKKSVASRPGDPVYACRYREVAGYDFAVEMQWWIFYRRVEGKWTLVNERIITSADGYRIRQNILARAAKIWDLAIADNWAGVAQYTTPAAGSELKAYIETQEGAEGPFDPESSPPRCEQVKAARVSTYGRFNCRLPQIYTDDADHGLAFNRINDRWLATDVIDLEPRFP